MGHNVDIADAFRVGRFDAYKSRPIIVKLRSTWDKRLITVNCHKLKNFAGRICIAPDEPLDERRKKAFYRIKSRAEKARKDVSVSNGILYVDDAQVYSLEEGNLIRNGKLYECDVEYCFV